MYFKTVEPPFFNFEPKPEVEFLILEPIEPNLNDFNLEKETLPLVNP